MITFETATFPALPTDPPLVPGIDPDTPSTARLYDYYLGGTCNYPSDRRAAEVSFYSIPLLKTIVADNRDFLRRCVRYLVKEHGIRQFLDVGSGLPTAENTHEVAIQAVVDAGGQPDDMKIVYCDSDPTVLTHGRHILVPDPGAEGAKAQQSTIMVAGDVFDMDNILHNEEVRKLIDFEKPVAIMFMALFHFVPDDLVQKALASTTSAIADESFIVLTHMSYEGPEPETAATVKDMYIKAGVPLYWRNKEDVNGLVKGHSGWHLFEPDSLVGSVDNTGLLSTALARICKGK